MKTPRANYNSANQIRLADLPLLVGNPATRRQVARLMRHHGEVANRGLQRLIQQSIQMLS